MNSTAHIAIGAGYSAKTAYSQAGRLLKNVEVQKYIEKRRADQTKRTEIEAENLAKLSIRQSSANLSAILASSNNQTYIENLRKPEIARHIGERQSSHLLTIVNLNGSGKTCQTLSSGHDECFDQKSKSIKERTGILREGWPPPNGQQQDRSKIASRVGRATKHPKITTRPRGANGTITARLAELRQTEKRNLTKPNI